MLASAESRGLGNRLRLWQHHSVSGSPTTLEVGFNPVANTLEEELVQRLEEVGLVWDWLYLGGLWDIQAGGISGPLGTQLCNSGARSGWKCKVENLRVGEDEWLKSSR